MVGVSFQVEMVGDSDGRVADIPFCFFFFSYFELFKLLGSGFGHSVSLLSALPHKRMKKKEREKEKKERERDNCEKRASMNIVSTLHEHCMNSVLTLHQLCMNILTLHEHCINFA